MFVLSLCLSVSFYFSSAIRSDKLGAYEYSKAKRWESEQKMAIRTRKQQIMELKQVAERQVEAAQAAHETAAKKATASHRQAIETIEAAEELRNERWQHRVQAVLELRDNQNAVRAKAATESERKTSKILATQRQLEEEKAGLLGRGINPYAEFRQREISAQDAATEKNLKDAVKQNKADLAVRLIREGDEDRRRDEEAVIHKVRGSCMHCVGWY